MHRIHDINLFIHNLVHSSFKPTLLHLRKANQKLYVIASVPSNYRWAALNLYLNVSSHFISSHQFKNSLEV